MMELLYWEHSGVRLCVRHYGGNGPVLLLLHGLTANGAAFEAIVQQGLTGHAQVYAPDLRGRGLSAAPDSGYSMAHHAADLLALMDAMHWQKVVLAGHSFGAFVSWYMAAHHAHRVAGVVAMDAAMRMHPRTLEMLGPSLGRLTRQWPSFAAYLADMQRAPYLNFWDPAMEAYYHADVATAPDGSVAPIPQAATMTDAARQVLAEPWGQILPAVQQPVLMLHAPDVYTQDAPLLPYAYARETAALLPQVQFVQVPGNHQTMLYGPGAAAIANAMEAFLAGLATSGAWV